MDLPLLRTRTHQSVPNRTLAWQGVNSVIFSDFLKMLYPYCADGNKPADFVVAMAGNIIEETDDDYNPFLDKKPDYLKRIYNGSKPISQKDATHIVGHSDKRRFESYLSNFSDDAILGIQAALANNRIPVEDKYNVPSVCASVLIDILTAIAAKSRQTMLVSHETVSLPEKYRIPQYPLSTIYIQDGKIHVGDISIKLPERLLPPVEIRPDELLYIKELLAAYADAESVEDITKETLPNYHPKYQRNFEEQRKHYYNADYIRQSVREVFIEEDNIQFEVLKDDVYDSVSITYNQDYDNGYTRLIEVLKHASIIPANKSLLVNIPNLIGGSEKMGVCHILVNDGKIKWVAME